MPGYNPRSPEDMLVVRRAEEALLEFPREKRAQILAAAQGNPQAVLNMITTMKSWDPPKAPESLKEARDQIDQEKVAMFRDMQSKNPYAAAEYLLRHRFEIFGFDTLTKRRA